MQACIAQIGSISRSSRSCLPDAVIAQSLCPRHRNRTPGFFAGEQQMIGAALDGIIQAE
jgi:hypothetical protein